MPNLQEGLLNALDIDYSFHLAQRMEQYSTNPVLGFRTAGSQAARQTGDMLLREMEHIGLSNVHKDEITVDGWEFRSAVLGFDAPEGHTEVQLGAYQANLTTKGFERLPLVYLGSGGAADYRGRDVRGKLVLVDINQRDEWWINYPVYQAHLKGARALIAVQRGGYGDVDNASLNAQDISGPADAPAFSIAQRDADRLMALMDEKNEVSVTLKADSRVMPQTKDYNIVGQIPGQHPERMVLLSSHYDSYFWGFQDDNAAVSMMLGIAKTLLECGVRPRNTLVFCAMAAEEWGVSDSCFDWSTGAYEQVFTVHPEWRGRVIADLNFELPALAHGTRARIRSCYAYTAFLNEFIRGLPPLTPAYPHRTSVTAPNETWSDDFSMMLAGIPSMVNDFTGGSFMSTHYHSQFDDRKCYDPQVYRLHHELFLLLILALDRTCIVPLCFAPIYQRAMQREPRDSAMLEAFAPLRERWSHQEESARQDYEQVRETNLRYAALLDAGENEAAEELFLASREQEKELLARFFRLQQQFVRIDWNFGVGLPHELLLDNIEHLEDALYHLQNDRVADALRDVYYVDNNAYAFTFDRGVYEHFSAYVFDQPKERLKWGFGRVLPHEDLYGVVRSLLEKQVLASPDCREEQAQLKKALENQKDMLRRLTAEMTENAGE